MKHTSKHNAGFTLIELVVAMAIAVVVTAAATSVLLMGLRVNRQSSDTASQQITVRTLLSVMEDMASEGNIKEVVSNVPSAEGEPDEYGSWMLKDKDGRIVFQYNATEQKIYTNDTPVLENVIASNAILEGQLLSISIETKDGVYTSSVYCRTAEPEGAPDIDQLPGIGGDAGREKFIKILKSQYRSRGEIVYTGDIVKEAGDFDYYSEWYIGGYDKDDRWNSKTPWCACFVSWALAEAGYSGSTGHEKWYANVDDFMEHFTTTPSNATSTWIPGGGNPTPGDLIFFDWDKGTDPEHVGVVLSVDVTKNMVYTIEGNSAGRVTVRSYTLSDPRIIGYGVIFQN